jgi:hypothetical protein
MSLSVGTRAISPAFVGKYRRLFGDGFRKPLAVGMRPAGTRINPTQWHSFAAGMDRQEILQRISYSCGLAQVLSGRPKRISDLSCCKSKKKKKTQT